jgi:hypothetical protein
VAVSAVGASTANISSRTVFSSRMPPMLWQTCSPADPVGDALRVRGRRVQVVLRLDDLADLVDVER